jgi:hypothetical protein
MMFYEEMLEFYRRKFVESTNNRFDIETVTYFCGPLQSRKFSTFLNNWIITCRVMCNQYQENTVLKLLLMRFYDCFNRID